MDDLPDDWYEQHSGQSLVLDPAKVAFAIEQLRAALKPFAEADFEDWIATEDCNIPIEDFRRAREIYGSVAGQKT